MSDMGDMGPGHWELVDEALRRADELIRGYEADDLIRESGAVPPGPPHWGEPPEDDE